MLMFLKGMNSDMTFLKGRDWTIKNLKNAYTH